MLGSWRLILRQAHEAARAGRFEDARSILARPEVAGRRQALDLRQRIGKDLIERGLRALGQADVSLARDHLAQAERWGLASDLLAPLRRALIGAALREARDRLNAGDPQAAERVVDRVREDMESSAELRRLDELARLWTSALRQARAGEFARAAEQFEEFRRLAPSALRNPFYRFWSAVPLRGAIHAVERSSAELEERRLQSAPLVLTLHEALNAESWSDVLSVTADLLALAPEHPEARAARAAAWSRVHEANRPETREFAAVRKTPLGPKYARRPASANQSDPHPAPAAAARDRFLLWADTVGGYLVCLGESVTLGQATPQGSVDVPILGDLSRQHATIRRDSEGYVLHAERPTTVNGKAVDVVPLQTEDRIRMGSVELRFVQPNPLSMTARLEICSAHRLPLAVDAVILMADTWVLGETLPDPEQAGGPLRQTVLYRQAEVLWCRAGGTLEIDGRHYPERGPLAPRSIVRGLDALGATQFSFSLEPLAARLTAASSDPVVPWSRPAQVG